VGAWVIGGVSYTATAATVLETEYGALQPGVCVNVYAYPGDPTVARAIESERSYRCSGRGDNDDDAAEGKLYGVIESLPDGLIGNWDIGGKTLVVSTMTELDNRGRAFAVGVVVEAEFVTDADNVNHAREIELKFGRNDDDRDDDLYGDRPGREGKHYGTIDGKPMDGPVGIWAIGGIDYVVTSGTEFDDDDDYRLGERVKVEYVVNGDGMRRATEIDETDDDGGVAEPGRNKMVGFVESKPTAFVGTWVIAGAPFEANLNTRFEEGFGLLVVGAYVEVEYSIVNDARVMHELETQVPPGAGDVNRVGRLTAVGDARSATVQAASNSTLAVDGVSYVVTSATQVVDSGGALVPGANVFVNSFQMDGVNMATQVRTENHRLLLPLTNR
jgi:hypothetical protein